MPDKKHINSDGALQLTCSILLLILFSILCYFNRFAVDDYYHIHAVSEKGIIGSLVSGYNSFGGRWMSYVLWGVIYHFHETHAVIILYSLISVFMLCLAFFLMLRNITTIYNIKINAITNFNYALLFTASLFFLSGNKGEVWFWIVSTAMYLNSLTCFIFILALLILPKRNYLNFLIIIPCSIFAGGASETYALIYLLILSILFFYVRKKTEFFRHINKRMLIGVLILMSAAFIVSVAAPGNTERTGWLPERSITHSFITTLKALASFLIFKIIPKIHLLILFAIVWLLYGSNAAKETIKSGYKNILKNFCLSVFILLIALYIIMFPSCYLLSESGPDRALSLVTLFICLFAALWGYYIGYYGFISKNITTAANRIALILIAVFLGYNIISQYNIVSAYSTALDKRIEYLQSLKDKPNNHIEYVIPLPPSGFLYSAEISNDTAYFGNEHFRRGIFVNYKVAIKKD